MKTIINLTPHDVYILGHDGIPASGTVARVDVATTVVDTINGIDIVDTVYGDVQGLPAPADDTLYVVSRLIMAASPDRKDLLVPNDLIRNDKGQVMGAKNFARS